MEIVTKIEPGLAQSSSVAIGFFDGVHKGHQAVISRAVTNAAKLGVKTCIVTFKDHPQLVIEGRSPELLTSFEQRLKLFAYLGVDLTLALPFTPEISRLGPQEYVEKILIGAMGAQSVSIGYNHHFAHNRQGTPALLAELGKKLNFAVHVTHKVFVDGVEVSSSRIRQALTQGDLVCADKLLGRPYAISGLVVHGQDRGRLTGFHTANLKFTEHQLVPMDGVYAGMVRLAGKNHPCAINIGCRPTLTADQTPTVEVHVLNFDHDLYGHDLEVELWEYLRPEQKFSGIDALKEQIKKDCLRVKEIFAVTCAAGTQRGA